MAGLIFTVAQQKGGAGKTTLAAHLAVAWQESGLRVATLDIDPQGSLSHWFQLRTATRASLAASAAGTSAGTGSGPAVPASSAPISPSAPSSGRTPPDLTHVQITGWRTQREVERLAREHDVVVIDSPPHAETEARIAVRAATLVVVPIQPSPMDLWAAQPTLALARQEKVPLTLVLNRVPPRAKLTDTLIDQISTLVAPPAVTIALTQIGNRIGYAGAMLDGRTVCETARRTRAAEDIVELAAELRRRAGQG